MNKLMEYQRGLADGLLLALRIVKTDGVMGLEDEIKHRNITGVHPVMARKAFDQSLEVASDEITEAVIVLCVAALHDEFGFGRERCQRFIDKVETGSDFINDGLASMVDYIRSIEEQMGIKLIDREKIHGRKKKSNR